MTQIKKWHKFKNGPNSKTTQIQKLTKFKNYTNSINTQTQKFPNLKMTQIQKWPKLLNDPICVLWVLVDPAKLHRGATPPSGSFVFHLLVGFWWDEVPNRWDGSQSPTNRPSRFCDSILFLYQKGNLVNTSKRPLQSSSHKILQFFWMFVV